MNRSRHNHNFFDSKIRHYRYEYSKRGFVSMLVPVSMYKAEKYAVDMHVLDEKTRTFFLRNFGCARKVYNLYVDYLYNALEKEGSIVPERSHLQFEELPQECRAFLGNERELSYRERLSGFHRPIHCFYICKVSVKLQYMYFIQSQPGVSVWKTPTA